MPSPLGSSARLIVLTGLSGAGKSEAVHALEDLGYFCVDNLPVALLDAFAERLEQDITSDAGTPRRSAVVADAGTPRRSAVVADAGTPRRSAVVADVRDPCFLDDFPSALHTLRRRSVLGTVVVFLEAGDEALVRRFSETRRPHPLAPDRSVLEGIVEERARLRNIKRDADHVVDTSDLTVHELRRVFTELSQGRTSAGLVVTLVSFGFKYGIPLEADLLLDVRFLSNPYFDPALRPLTGRDEAVQRYLDTLEAARTFLAKTTELLEFLIPEYAREGKRYLTIGVGCTGGRHRSVFVAERLQREVSSVEGVRLRVRHRDISKAV